MPETPTAKYRYIDSTDCQKDNCPVRNGETIEAREDGNDVYHLAGGKGLYGELFGPDARFAACCRYGSHFRVEKVE